MTRERIPDIYLRDLIKPEGVTELAITINPFLCSVRKMYPRPCEICRRVMETRNRFRKHLKEEGERAPHHKQ